MTVRSWPIPRDGERWVVSTERRDEAQRTGLGPLDLNRTLNHLAERGDTDAILTVGELGSARKVKLAALRPTG